MDSNSPTSTMPDIQELQPLLKGRGVITMPYYIDYEAFREMEWALDWNRDNNIRTDPPIVKFLGNGGDYSATTAVGEMLREYKAIGLLAGGSYSGHTIAFMMCPQRYTYESAYIGIHSASIMPNNRPYGNADFRIEAETHDYLDNQIAILFARESEHNIHDAAYWKKMHEEARLSTKLISGGELIHRYGLAKGMDYFPKEEAWRIGRRA